MKNNVPTSGTTWQEIADKSLVRDGMDGVTKRVKPESDKTQGNPAPKSNWPY